MLPSSEYCPSSVTSSTPTAFQVVSQTGLAVAVNPVVGLTKAPPSPVEGSRARGRAPLARGVACGRKRPHRGPQPQHQLVIFSDSGALPEDYSSLHQNGGRGIRYHRSASQEDQDAMLQVLDRQCI